MGIEIAAFGWVPQMAQGYVRDLRVRWALEEARLPYRVRLLGPGEAKEAAYRAWQPFGQVPAYRDREVEIFESGAILLRVAEIGEGLRPWDTQERAATQAWMFAALNSLEPYLFNAGMLDSFFAGQDWTEGFRPHAERMAAAQLAGLETWLSDRDWLTGRFGVADIMMATVLRDVRHTGLLAAVPEVAGYLERCLARPAFGVALEKQLADFRANAPAGEKVVEAAEV